MVKRTSRGYQSPVVVGTKGNEMNQFLTKISCGSLALVGLASAASARNPSSDKLEWIRVLKFANDLDLTPSQAYTFEALVVRISASRAAMQAGLADLEESATKHQESLESMARGAKASNNDLTFLSDISRKEDSLREAYEVSLTQRTKDGFAVLSLEQIVKGTGRADVWLRTKTEVVDLGRRTAEEWTNQEQFLIERLLLSDGITNQISSLGGLVTFVVNVDGYDNALMRENTFLNQFRKNPALMGGQLAERLFYGDLDVKALTALLRRRILTVLESPAAAKVFQLLAHKNNGTFIGS